MKNYYKKRLTLKERRKKIKIMKNIKCKKILK
jgi:hypothetical protein